jgi:hypothetical protein
MLPGRHRVLSSGLGPVEARPPGVKHKPWIKGPKRAWQTVYETDDQWTRSPFMWKYEWLRCSAKGNACAQIRGVQCSDGFCIQEPGGSEYMLTRKDVGHRIRVRVSAWNGAGRTTATSSPTRLIEQ